MTFSSKKSALNWFGGVKQGGWTNEQIAAHYGGNRTENYVRVRRAGRARESRRAPDMDMTEREEQKRGR